jgi:pimeloyl-ACP methyl ester carboxylesterase
VVLVHGLTEAGTTWPDLVGHWGDDWQVLAPDLRGHGRSPRFTAEELATSPEVLLADIVTVLDGQPEPVALLGHSLGGLLALRAAVARPDRVWALVLEDPARPTAGRTPDPGFVADTEEFLDTLADQPDQADQVARMLRESHWSPAEIQAWADCKPLVDRAYVRRGLYLGEDAWEELFDALVVPTLLLVPPGSPMAPRQEAFHNDLVRTVVVPGAGHCVRRDQPARYFRAVDAFLAEVGWQPAGLESVAVPVALRDGGGVQPSCAQS